MLSLNYAPEPIGIGPYSAGTARALADAGHAVQVVTAHPYYPAWQTADEDRRAGWSRMRDCAVTVTRCPIYVPRVPSGARRIAHHASFALSAAGPMITRAVAARPDLVFAVAPSLIAAPVALMVGRASGARTWLHVQDFEVEAAFATGMVGREGAAARVAQWFERGLLRRFDRVSTISPNMGARLVAKGVAAERVVEFRNWADDMPRHKGPIAYRGELDIRTPYVALYSGNIASKQGIGILIDAAKLLAARTDLTMLICGEGPNLPALKAAATGMGNVRFAPLQPRERLPELLALASVHLLPQLAEAADLVLPSKLANMLASGRPVIATAAADTGLARAIEGCGIVVPPGDAAALAAAIGRLLDDDVERQRLGEAAERHAAHWQKRGILDGFLADVAQLGRAAGRGAA